MARIKHSNTVLLKEFDQALQVVRKATTDISIASSPFKIYEPTPYGYMFPQLQMDPTALLPSGKETVRGLCELGREMNESGDNPKLESGIPSAYTYFGQFVDHDISLELQSDDLANLDNPDLMPLNFGEIGEKIKNRRSPTLDLDSVYGVTATGLPVPRVCAELRVGPVAFASKVKEIPGLPPPNIDGFNDVPRGPANKNGGKTDRQALIGDERNDENLIISQMHVAFLRAHNAFVRQGLNFNAARKMLVQHYQAIIIDDYLMRVCDPETISEILTYGNRFFRSSNCKLYMPLEFSGAAFRFGHSMVRSRYAINRNFQGEKQVTLKSLFELPMFKGLPTDLLCLPEQCVIEWRNFLDTGPNQARLIDTLLVDPLSSLIDPNDGASIKGTKGSLAVRNLLRGYLLRVPTGQRVAQACGFAPMTPQEILEASTPEQQAILSKYNFHKDTPLWYYILAEAAQRNALGPVGSTIVGEVLIGLVRWTDDSILSEPNWKSPLVSEGSKFTLQNLFQFAGVWS